MSKKLATRLTPAIKAWIKEEFKSDYYEKISENNIFHFPNFTTHKGFLDGNHVYAFLDENYTEVSEKKFLSKFSTKKTPIIQYYCGGLWIDCIQEDYRIKPTPGYLKEIKALQKKEKESGMKVTINF